jgi:hypothetical protein
MATYNYSRAVNADIQVKENSKFDASLAYSRSDDASVDFSGKTIKMDIYQRDAVILTLTSGTEITISTRTLTFDKTFTTLNKRSYDYELYNDTDKIGIMYGKLIVV